MYHITVSPNTFTLTKPQIHQNPYIDISIQPNIGRAKQQHKYIVSELTHNVHFKIKDTELIPDMVFVASLGLSLPRLPEPLVILPNMLYENRKRELKYAKEIFNDLEIKTVPFPNVAVFEGQAETKWFDGGRLLIVGYGFRATKASVSILEKLLTDIYNSYGVEPPKVVGVRLRSFDFYHLDMALLPYSSTGCFIQKGAFSDMAIERLRKEIGEVTLINTDDKFCLNSIVDSGRVLTHTLKDGQLKRLFETKFGMSVIECDVSEFEKSGGAIACMVFDVFDPRIFKRKNSGKNAHSPTAPLSPK